MSVFVVSDTHFGHAGVCRFLNPDGSKLRPWESTDEMDEYMVEAWNSVVRPSDKVYHLGDVVMNRKALPILGRLNGRKVLIKGNHDVFRLAEYAEYFEDVMGCHVLDGIVLTHVPVHPSALDRFGINVHGHLHAERVMRREYADYYTEGYTEVIDERYVCVSVEQTEYRPISFDEVRSRV